jgi:hypothetical protein
MDLPFILVIGIGGLLIGILLAGLVYSLREEAKSADLPAFSQAGSHETPLAPGGLPERVELARLLSQAPPPHFLVEMDGRIYREPQDLDEDQLRRLIIAWQELSDWINPGHLKEQAGADHSQQDQIPQGSSTLPEELQTNLTRPLAMDPVTALLDLAKPEHHEAGPPHLKSLAEQVDEILQEQLAGSDDDQPLIRLLDSPTGGLLVQVGTDQYEGITTVPDEGIQNIIRNAVKEWENRSASKS